MTHRRVTSPPLNCRSHSELALCHDPGLTPAAIDAAERVEIDTRATPERGWRASRGT